MHITSDCQTSLHPRDIMTLSLEQSLVPGTEQMSHVDAPVSTSFSILDITASQ